jgi:hypothetical protein
LDLARTDFCRSTPSPATTCRTRSVSLIGMVQAPGSLYVTFLVSLGYGGGIPNCQHTGTPAHRHTDTGGLETSAEGGLEFHQDTFSEGERCYCVRFEVFTAVTMKIVVFWDINTQFVLHRRHITSPLQGPVS